MRAGGVSTQRGLRSSNVACMVGFHDPGGFDLLTQYADELGKASPDRRVSARRLLHVQAAAYLPLIGRRGGRRRRSLAAGGSRGGSS